MFGGKLNIVESPNPLLNRVCEPCDLNDRSLARLSKQMFKAMYENNGIGLAAPQVGVLKRIIVVDVPTLSEEDEDGEQEEESNPMTLVNPEVVEAWGEPETVGEGCLSCPGITVPIERLPWVRVRYYDLAGDQWEIESDGLLARCLQHEIDHLNGITLFESAAPRERIKALTAYEEAKRNGARPGETSSEPKVR